MTYMGGSGGRLWLHVLTIICCQGRPLAPGGPVLLRPGIGETPLTRGSLFGLPRLFCRPPRSGRARLGDRGAGWRLHVRFDRSPYYGQLQCGFQSVVGLGYAECFLVLRRCLRGNSRDERTRAVGGGRQAALPTCCTAVSIPWAGYFEHADDGGEVLSVFELQLRSFGTSECGDISIGAGSGLWVRFDRAGEPGFQAGPAALRRRTTLREFFTRRRGRRNRFRCTSG